MNWSKLKTLVWNGSLPAGGAATVFWLAFGFGWWIFPLSILIGMGTSLVTTKPNSLMLPADNKYANLALKEAELDKKIDRL